MSAKAAAGADDGVENKGAENASRPERAPDKVEAPVEDGVEFVRRKGGIFAAPKKRRWWPFGLYRVAGESMLPAYRPGDTLLGWRWFARLHPGRVVVAHRGGRPLIKRVARVAGGQVWLLGDNPPHSTDSRHFGTVSSKAVEAIIILRLP